MPDRELLKAIAQAEAAARSAASEAIEDALRRHDAEWARVRALEVRAEQQRSWKKPPADLAAGTEERARRVDDASKLRTSSYFEILGVSPTCDSTLLADAYQSRLRIAGDPERRRLLEEAFAVLSHPARCKAYFEGLSAWKSPLAEPETAA